MSSHPPQAADAASTSNTAMLESQPEREDGADLLPVNEFEIRLDLAKKFASFIQEHDDMYQISTATLVVFYTHPIRDLQHLTENDIGASELRHCLQLFERASYRLITLAEKAKTTTQGRSATTTSQKKTGPGESAETIPYDAVNRSEDSKDRDDSDNEADTYQNRKKKNDNPNPERDQAEKNKCLERDDGHCVITKSKFPVAAHIVPFACDDCCENHKVLRSLCWLEDIGIPINTLWKSGTLAYSDVASNMISLSPDLHSCWGKAMFGLKPMGILNDIDDASMGYVEFQFVRLPRGHGKRVFKPVNLNEEGSNNPQSLINELRAQIRPQDLFVTNAEHRSCVESGQVFCIRCPIEDALHMESMLKIQWALIRVSAMSGMADAIDRGFNPGPEPIWPVLRWLEEQIEITHSTDDG